MAIILASLLTIGVVAYILSVRAKDLPAPEPVSPFQHLDERKASIYENLRDLQFEYRLGKLSDEDYQITKKDLQRDLAGVMAEIDRLKAALPRDAATQGPRDTAARAAAAPADEREPQGFVCPHCRASFPQALKFCGECGKPMKAVPA